MNKNRNKISVIGLSGESIFMKVSTLPKPAVTIQAKTCYNEPGGKGFNQAVTAKKLGSNVSYLTAVGNDSYGNKCKEYLDKLGIINYCIKKGSGTAIATILTDNTSENEVIVYPGASLELNREDVEIFRNEIESSNYLIIQFELPLEVIETAILIAKKSNTKIILNPAPAKYSNFKYLNYVEIITPNEKEARSLFNIPEDVTVDELGEYLKDKVENILLMTLGKKGVLLVNNKTYKFYSAIMVNSVDTTGAGDIFNGSLAYYLNVGKTLDEAIKLAIIASGLSVTKSHVMNSIPTNEEIYQFQKLYNLKEIK